MRRLGSILLGLAATLTVAAGVILHGCRDNPAPTSPEFASAKTGRTLTVTGAGTGGGHVTAPQVLEVPPLDCYINAGTYNPDNCTKTYP